MSARNELLSALASALDPDLFRVSTAADTPDQIDPGTLSLRAFTKEVTPAAIIGAVQCAVSLWMVSGKLDTSTVDDALDAGLDPVLEALLPLKWVEFVSASRGLMDDTWHGYLFTLNLFQTGA